MEAPLQQDQNAAPLQSEIPATSVSESVPGTKKRGKNKKGNKDGQSPMHHTNSAEANNSTTPAPKDLVSLAKKTALSDVEIQQVIDILLTKQSGAPPSTSDWVEPMSSADKSEAKQLQRQLAEKDALLSEEMGKSRAFAERLNGLKQELGNHKTTCMNQQRYIEDMKNQHGQSVQMMEQKYVNEVGGLRRDVATLQGQIQYHMTHNQNLQANIDALQQAQVDPAIYTEIEQLRNTKLNYESELANLQNQLALQQEETHQIQNRYSQASRQVSS